MGFLVQIRVNNTCMLLLADYYKRAPYALISCFPKHFLYTQVYLEVIDNSGEELRCGGSVLSPRQENTSSGPLSFSEMHILALEHFHSVLSSSANYDLFFDNRML